MPKVSVIMSAYNCNNVIGKSIESILEQAFNDFEFIICDDGSTDGTYDIILKYADNDPRIRIIKNKINVGLAQSLNKCIEYTSGEYIARQDADDYSHPERLMKQVAALDKNTQFDFVSSNVYLFEENQIWGVRRLKEFPLKKDFLWGNPFVHPATIFRKSAIMETSYYRVAKETKRVEDFDLFARMYSKGLRGYNLQEPLFYYCEDKSSYKKRKYTFRINEAIIRYKAFKALKLFPIGIIYVIKPLVVGIIPSMIMIKLHRIIDRKK